jgi:hypothetical protein
MANPHGIFYRQATFGDPQSHLNMTNLAIKANESDNIKDLGLITFWSQAMKSELPLFKWSDFDTNNIIEHDSDYYKYKVGVKTDKLIRIVKDLSNSEEPGADDEKFEILVDSDCYGPGTLLKPSQFSEFALLVSTDQIRPVGDNFIITVQHISNTLKFTPKEYLQANQPLGRFGSLRSPEYGQEYTPWKLKGLNGAKEYIIKVSNAEVNAHYWLSSKVCEFSDGTSDSAITLKNYFTKVKEYYRVEGVEDPTVNDLNSPKSDMTMDQMKGALASGKASGAFAYLMDDISYGIIHQDEMQMLMWSPGGLVKGYDGQEEIMLPTGLWTQLKSGYLVPYNVMSFDIGILETGLRNYILGRRNLSTIGQEPEITLETGWGGMYMVSKAIQNKYETSGFGTNVQLHNSEFGFISGKSSNLKTHATLFTGFTVEGVFSVNIKYNPAFDNTWNASELDNPMIQSPFGTHRLSSFCFIAYNVNDKKDNIYLLRRSDAKVRHYVIAGTETHPMYRQSRAGFMDGGAKYSHLASSHKSGFGAFMSKRVGTIWVKDPTQILVFLPYNPKTGRPFGNLM